ncbi:hypothetical protein X943_001967 [Babesia divergens]|uniref:DNA damage-binding protein 1 n=1 Tax=Babesia divergens TaxID=32595 RepID=A0AAD9GAH9_BABDI|nr:hypothetical protein X943_001967 [Babesia divergens]
MDHLYTYFVTSAPGGATQNALCCRLAPNSEQEYLVCLKKYSIDVYSLEKVVKSGEDDKNDHQGGAPVLTVTLKAHATLLTFAEYRPPGSNQSHLLVVTSNLVLLLLTFDEKNSKFISRPVLSLQEPNGQDIESEVVLRIDPDYNLILFHGQKKILKCVILSNNDYFSFKQVITLRTGHSIFLDFMFVDSGYRRVGVPPPDNFGFNRSPIPPTNIRLGRRVLDCRLLLITANSLEVEGDKCMPEIWYSGIQLFFDLEYSTKERKFISYGSVPLFGEPVSFTKQFKQFLPLKLNSGPGRNDSVLLLGCQALGFVSIRDPRSIKILHTDISIGDICSYCTIEENKRYLLGDDTGVLYLLDLITSNNHVENTLKRRAGVGDSDNTLTKISDSATWNRVVDIVLKRIGVYSPPTALVRLAPDLFYIATSVGNCKTVRIRGISGPLVDAMPESADNSASGMSGIEATETWRQTNLGPILDFTFGPKKDHGSPSILACCGYGPEGRVCNIALGIGINVFATHDMKGIRNVFTVECKATNPGAYETIMCCVSFRCSRFFRVTIPGPKCDSTACGRTALDVNQQGDWVVTRIDPASLGLIDNERTILFDIAYCTLLLQVTINNVVVLDISADRRPSVTLNIEEACGWMGIEYTSDMNIVYAMICDRQLLLILSNQHILMIHLEDMKLLCWRKLYKHTSACAYLSGTEMKRGGYGGLLALLTWEESELYLLNPTTLEVVHQSNMLCAFGISVSALRFGVVGEAVYIFVALSDGSLMLYKVNFSKGPVTPGVADHDTEISLVMRNIHKISDCALGLVPLNISGNPAAAKSCNLACTNLVTTGTNPTLIYATKGKIEYVRINVPNISTLCGIISAGSQSCFGVPLVYITANSQLCMGELDTAGQLHVETICSGRSFDKICYHQESDLLVVGCAGEVLANSESNQGLRETTADPPGTVFRCMNSDPAKCLPGMTRLDACIKFVYLNTKEVIHTLTLPARHLVSSISTVSFEGHRTMIAIGTSRVSELEDMPREGHIYLVDIVSSSFDRWDVVLLRTVTPLSAGIVEMSACTNALVVALNDTVVVMTLRRDDTPSLSHSHGQSNIKAHKLEAMHHSDDSYGQFSLVERAEYVSCTYVVSLDTNKDIIVVGDLMNSVRILRWRGNELKELSKDFNSMYCTAVAAIDKTRCIVSDSSGNLCVFAKINSVTNDRQALKVEDIGLFHHGENINKIMMNPIREAASASADDNSNRDLPDFFTHANCIRGFCCSQIMSILDAANASSVDVVKRMTAPNRFWNYQFKSVFTCATSAGSLIQLCLFEDDKLFYRLSLLEEAINSIQADIGNISNRHWRTFKNKWSINASKGFIDGDVVESFLELDADLRQQVFDGLLRNDTEGLFYSPELLVLEIEYIKRLRR